MMVIALLVSVFVGCSREDKAQRQFDEAYRLEQGGSVADAELSYRQLLTQYPDTPAARKAEQRLAQLLKQRQLAIIQSGFAALDSVHKVVLGYRSMFNRWPKSSQDFDTGEYFFDSDYMAESVPEGYRVSLVLTDNADGYRLWSFPAEGDVGFQLTATGRSVVEVNKAETLAAIEADYQLETQKGALSIFISQP